MKRKSNSTSIASSKYETDTGRMAALLAPYGVTVSTELADRINAYVRLLLVWNRKVNLTAIEDPEQILERHFGEAFLGATAVPISSGQLVDVGSGAGFPGLAIKLLKSELGVTLIEANQKKAAFLREVRRELDLENVKVERARFEDLNVSAPFADYITTRALGCHHQILNWASGALHKFGKVVLWLGRKDWEQIATVPGWEWRKPINLPQSRALIIAVAQNLEKRASLRGVCDS